MATVTTILVRHPEMTRIGPTSTAPTEMGSTRKRKKTTTYSRIEKDENNIGQTEDGETRK